MDTSALVEVGVRVGWKGFHSYEHMPLIQSTMKIYKQEEHVYVKWRQDELSKWRIEITFMPHIQSK